MNLHVTGFAGAAEQLHRRIAADRRERHKDLAYAGIALLCFGAIAYIHFFA